MPNVDSPVTALVVGDDRGAALKKVSTTLRKAGFAVVTVSDGQAALDLSREQQTPMDLAVIDTNAAGINAPEIERQLHDLNPQIPMLFLSDDNPAHVQEADSLGHVSRVLPQPYRRSRLLGRVLEMTPPRTMTA
jgi:CheY-like chemotaxis protein